MANPEALVRGAAIVVGLLFGALGLFVTLMALGAFGGGWASGATPTCLAMFVTWAAFGAAARTPSTAAAVGSVLLWLFVAVMGVIGLRRLLRRG